MSTLLTKLFTVNEYIQMNENGILNSDERLELIAGEIIKMSPIGIKHSATVNRLTHIFYEKFRNLAIISVQNAILLNNNSLPQPDLSLLIPRRDFYQFQYPQSEDIFLLIEVADTTLSTDRNIKIPLYGKNKIRESWLVNINDGCIETYYNPTSQGYKEMKIFNRGESVFLQSFPEIEINVNDIL